MKSAPTLSVLMPVYNGERYVAEAVESILAQTLSDFEFLILDDGSTDRSLEILQSYARKDSRIRLISRPNTGLVGALNELLDQATGELIARMDADDVALPNRFARQVEFLNSNPDVVCLGSAYQLIDEGSRLLLTCFDVPEVDAEIQKQLLAGLGGIHHPTVMFRRAIAISLGGYDEAVPACEDLDLWMRMGEVGKLANLPEPVVQYRLHTRSISGQNPDWVTEQSRIACERAWKRRGIEGQFEATGEWRPSADNDSRHRFMLQYGWWAFNSCQRRTAMLYGSRAIATKPFDLEGWRLLTCAVVKPLPEGKME